MCHRCFVGVRRQPSPRGGAENTGYSVVRLDTFGEDTADAVQLILISDLVGRTRARAPLAVATGMGLDIGYVLTSLFEQHFVVSEDW